jgi:hypothetical protein
MTETRPITRTETTTGDVAIDGLLAGIGAGIVMIGYLVIAGLVTGAKPAIILGRFDPGDAANPITGLLSHLAVAGVYGVLFGIGWRPAKRLKLFARLPDWLVGSVFGLALFAVAATLLLPGTGSPLRAFPAIHFAVAHVLYGVSLGALISRQRKA